MMMARGLPLALAIVSFLALGCGRSDAVDRQAGLAVDRMQARTASEAPQQTPRDGSLQARAPQSDEPRRVIYFAPRDRFDAPVAEASSSTTAAIPAAAPAQSTGPASKPSAPKTASEFPPLAGSSFGEIFKADLKEAPGKLWNGTKLSFGNLTNVAILGATFGVDQIVRNNVDAEVRQHLREHHRTSLSETREFGEVAGHPGLHFAAATAWYFWSVDARDAKNHALAKVLIEALAINDLTTGALQASVNQRDPRGDKFGWPSGHTSSSFCVAAVLHEYYGWQAGVPAYLLAGYIGATRVTDRRHNVSDVVFGTGLGLVIGHSVVRGELPKVGGFTVLPYSNGDGGGLMFVKSF